MFENVQNCCSFFFEFHVVLQALFVIAWIPERSTSDLSYTQILITILFMLHMERIERVSINNIHMRTLHLG